LQAIDSDKGQLAERYVLENISRIFPDHKVLPQQRLPGGHFVDLYLRDKEGRDVFVEVKSTKIGREALGQILDYYSAILNYDPRRKPEDMRFILVGDGIDPDLKYDLDRLNIKFIPLEKLGFSYQKLRDKIRERLSKTLTPTEAKMVSEWQASGQKVVTIDTLAKRAGNNRNYASKLARRLVRKGWLSNISLGVYGFVPASHGYENRFPSMNPFLVGGTLVQPYYFAYSTANARHGFTKQLPSTYYIATTQRRPAYQWRNIRFRFVALSDKKFFGFKEVEIFGAKVNIADPEKALVDAVDKMQYCGGVEEVLGVIHRGLKRTDEAKIIDYAARMESYSLNQRFGFMIDYLYKHKLISKPSPRLREWLLQHVGKTPIYLDAERPRHGEYFKEWNIIQNVPERELLAEVE
jgi:predicted transcriptional regulator of viral defense system